MRKEVAPGEIIEAEKELGEWVNDAHSKDTKLIKEENLRKMNIDDEPVKKTRVYPIRGSGVVPPVASSSSRDSNSTNSILREIDSSKRGDTASDKSDRIKRKLRRETEYNRLVNNKKSVVTNTLNNKHLSKKNNNENTNVTYTNESHVYSDYDYLESMSELTRIRSAEIEKTKGNEFFKTGEYQDAFLCYTRSIIFHDKLSATFSNRAIVDLKLNKLELAEYDCNDALLIEDIVIDYMKKDTIYTKITRPIIKILSRRGMARVRLGKYGEAIEDFTIAMESSVVNHIENATNEVEQLLKKAYEKYEEVEGKPYVLLNQRNASAVGNSVNNKVKKEDTFPISVIPITNMAPTSTYFYTFKNVDYNKGKHTYTILSEGELLPTPAATSNSVSTSTSGPNQFTRINITMSDSEEEEDVSNHKMDNQSNAEVSGFSRIPITNSSDSEEEVEDIPVNTTKVTRIPIVEDDDEEEEEKLSAVHAPVVLTESECIQLKENGNKHMIGKDYHSAIGCYSTAVASLTAVSNSNNNTVLIACLNNRAAAYLELNQYDACITDCSTVIGLEPTTIKAFYRRALCHEKRALDNIVIDAREKISLYNKSLQDISTLLNFESKNKQGLELQERVLSRRNALVEQCQAVSTLPPVPPVSVTTSSPDVTPLKEVKPPAPPVASTTTGTEVIEDRMSIMDEVEFIRNKVKKLLCSNTYNPIHISEPQGLLLGAINKIRIDNTLTKDKRQELLISVYMLLVTVYQTAGGQEKLIIETCSEVIMLQSGHIKAYLKRAEANKSLVSLCCILLYVENGINNKCVL